MAQLTPEEQAEEAPRSRPSLYLPWSIIEKAVSGEQILQDEAAFMRRTGQVDQLRQAARHDKLKWVFLSAWFLSVTGYLLAEVAGEGGIPAVAFLGSVTACVTAITLVAIIARKMKRRPRTTITARSTLGGLLALGALAPVALRYLHSIPVIARHPAASGAVDGLGVIEFALLAALTLWAVLGTIDLMRIRAVRRQFPDLLLFHQLAVLAKQLSESGPPDGIFSAQKRLCDHIEQSAQAVDAMANAMASPWHPDDEALRRSFASVASGLRALKREVALPNDTYAKLADQACKLCMISAIGLYGLLPTADAPDSSAVPSRRARITLPAKRAAAAVLPFALYLLLLAFPSLLKSLPLLKHDLPTIGLASLLWLLLYVIKFLDPNYSDVLASLKNMPFV